MKIVLELISPTNTTLYKTEITVESSVKIQEMQFWDTVLEEYFHAPDVTNKSFSQA